MKEFVRQADSRQFRARHRYCAIGRKEAAVVWRHGQAGVAPPDRSPYAPDFVPVARAGRNRRLGAELIGEFLRFPLQRADAVGFAHPVGKQVAVLGIGNEKKPEKDVSAIL